MDDLVVESCAVLSSFLATYYLSKKDGALTGHSYKKTKKRRFGVRD